MDLTSRSGVLTGAGTGIGRQLALTLAAEGATLLLVGRHSDSLAETAELMAERGGTGHVFAADITVPSTVEDVAQAARDRLGTVDLLINNAGNVRAGRLDEADPEDIRAMIDLNLTAPILLTRALLPDLRRAAVDRTAIILSIASGIALVNLPFYATYAATKTGIAAFGHSLRRELYGADVHVATVYPGATATRMMDSSTAGESLGFGRRPVEDVVDDVLAALRRDEHEINTSLPSRRRLQQLHATAPLEVDEALAPQLADLEAAVRDHRSI